MATSFTIDQVKKKAADNNIFMSDADMALATRNPDAGMSILNYKIDYGRAKTDEGRAAANKGAEEIRSAYGGYSGGADGSKFYMDAPSPQSFTYEDAPKYEDTYKGTRDELIDAIVNHKPFEYDYKTDPNYGAYAKMYRREGERASANALAQAAANTGGVASTAAVTAAQQAGNYYGSQLADKLPELYDAAYDRWFNEFTMKQNKLAAVQGESANEYDKYLTELNQHNTDKDFAYNQLLDSISHRNEQRNFDYQIERDAIEDAIRENETAYEREWNEKTFDYQVRRDEIEDAIRENQTKYDREQDALSWQYQYAQDAKADGERAEEKALESAYIRASLGDYAPLAEYYGISLAQAAQYWETTQSQNTATSAGAAYTNGDVMAAYSKLTSGGTLSDDDYDALLAAGYTMDELMGAHGTVTSPYGNYSEKEFNDKLYKFASEYYDVDENEVGNDAALLGAVSLVHEAGDSDEVKAAFRMYFGEDAYARYILGNDGLFQYGAATERQIREAEAESGVSVEEANARLKSAYMTDYDVYNGKIPREEWELAKKSGNGTYPIKNYATYEEYSDAYEEMLKDTGKINDCIYGGGNDEIQRLGKKERRGKAK